MSLFISRLSRDVHPRDLEELFVKYGKLTRCEIKGSFGFVTFENERDAEEALEECNGKDVCGSRIDVEWAKATPSHGGAHSHQHSHENEFQNVDSVSYVNDKVVLSFFFRFIDIFI